MINLVGNSIKFTEQGEIVLDVSLDPDTAQNDETVGLFFSVRDTGIGIPEAKLQRIFEAFEQAGTSMTRRYEGTGLGLAISSRLVEMMGGRLHVESQEGQGSTFYFTATFGLADEQMRPERGSRSLAGRRVLVVDDNSTNRRILEEMLLNWMTVPTLVASADEALSAMETAAGNGQAFDLILTDANMPDVDGFQFVRSLRERDNLQAPVIMMITSSGRLGDVELCSKLGIESYLIKPVKQSELFDAIVERLGIESAVDDDDGPGEGGARHARQLDVLLAEDSAVNQKLAIALIEKWGHHIQVASNGRRAVQMWETGSFDVILMDIQMPEMDGLEATRTIRERETGRGSHTPIIAMTAHALKGDEERCLAAGMDAYISKPIRAPLLFERLSSVCDVETVPAAASPEPVAGPPAGKLIDWESAREIVGGDDGLLREIVSAVLEECPAQMQNLTDALETGELERARRAVHTVLGNLRALAIEAAMPAAIDVEQRIRDGSVESLAEPVDVLRRTTDRVYSELRHWLES